MAFGIIADPRSSKPDAAAGRAIKSGEIDDSLNANNQTMKTESTYRVGENRNLDNHYMADDY